MLNDVRQFYSDALLDKTSIACILLFALVHIVNVLVFVYGLRGRQGRAAGCAIVYSDSDYATSVRYAFSGCDYIIRKPNV